ncbi:hypothetical protein [Cupriavidus numazuensis]|uniref:Uncharacterized protein n=1 Tax=Cupriavidus numazuensis TaxID=221992 RepID=A0ABN7PVI4_9BURK|nr:hypothetical protein [Cupriavidus numazuensis]CAG2141337.1 hypothetical protein LMG26411_02037 [Cupriavidus numazuensis]
MSLRYATCLALGLLATAASTTTLAREYVESGPVYVEPAPQPVYQQAPVLVAGSHVVVGWHGDRYWDGHRWWARDEWNRHHHRHDHHYDDHHYDHHDEHHG